MRELDVFEISCKIEEMCIRANKTLCNGLYEKICSAKTSETSPLAKSILSDIIDNLHSAKELDLPICQDTGMAVVFAEVGQDVHLIGSFEEAINEGVRRGYQKGYLRKSIVSDPLNRINTGDNTPAVIHTRLVEGDRVKLTLAPKGFGSENMSGIKMLNPSATREEVIGAVLEIVKKAGSNPCPPITVGIGIGSDFEGCALLAKSALCRHTENPNPFYKALEEEILNEINRLGIGPQGFGGDTTALYVNIESAPTHIAGLPLAVNIGCHVTRSVTEEI